MKIRPMVAELLPVEKQTDMTKLIVAFRSFGKARGKKKRHLQCIRRYGGLKSHPKHPFPLCIPTAVTA